MAPAALAATLAAAVLTQVEFPARYFDLVDGEPFPVAVVGLRDACCWRRWARGAPS